MQINQRPYRQTHAADSSQAVLPWAPALAAPAPTVAQPELRWLVQAQALAGRQATAHSRRMELLAERLSRHLAPEVWQRLFHGTGRQSIAFEEAPLAVLFIESLDLGGCHARQEPLPALVDRLARQSGGTVDGFGWGGTALFFTDVLDGLRTALALMQGVPDHPLRMGVHSCDAVVARFRSAGQWHSTLLGTATAEAATVSCAAAYRSIGMSAATQDLLQARMGLPLEQAMVPSWLFPEASWCFQRTANGSLRLIPTSLAPASS